MSKICTTREQSQKLIELGIDVNTADMWYDIGLGAHPSNIPQVKFNNDDKFIDCYYLYPAWSLAALLSVFSLPTLMLDEQEDGERGWFVSHYTDDTRYNSYYRDEPIDACYDLILKLKEKDLI